MPVLSVGTQRRYRNLAAALAAAAPHDEIQIDPGIYEDDGATVSMPLRIVGLGGTPILRSSGLLRNNKALLLTQADVTVEGIEFEGAASLNGNGAAIRHA